MENDGWLSAWSEPNVELVYQHTGERHLPKCPFVIEYGWAKRIACTCPHVVGVDDSYDKLQITIDTLTAERDRYREALKAIDRLACCPTCDLAYNNIVSAALDGEG